jgi:hypothetical protein
MISDRYPTRLIEELQNQARAKVRTHVLIMRVAAGAGAGLAAASIVYALFFQDALWCVPGAVAAATSAILFRYARGLERLWV